MNTSSDLKDAIISRASSITEKYIWAMLTESLGTAYVGMADGFYAMKTQWQRALAHALLEYYIQMIVHTLAFFKETEIDEDVIEENMDMYAHKKFHHSHQEHFTEYWDKILEKELQVDANHYEAQATFYSLVSAALDELYTHDETINLIRERGIDEAYFSRALKETYWD